MKSLLIEKGNIMIVNNYLVIAHGTKGYFSDVIMSGQPEAVFRDRYKDSGFYSITAVIPLPTDKLKIIASKIIGLQLPSDSENDITQEINTSKLINAMQIGYAQGCEDALKESDEHRVKNLSKAQQEIEQDWYCAAKHLRSLLEDSQNERIANARLACYDCKYNMGEACELNNLQHFQRLSNATGIQFFDPRFNRVNPKYNLPNRERSNVETAFMLVSKALAKQKQRDEDDAF